MEVHEGVERDEVVHTKVIKNREENEIRQRRLPQTNLSAPPHIYLISCPLVVVNNYIKDI